MSSRNQFSIEPLENRRLLSVAASLLTGPLTKGTTWTYKGTTTSGTFTNTTTVKGSAKVGKVNTTEIDTTTVVPLATTASKAYVALTKSGFDNYKITSTSTSGGLSTSQVHQFTPFLALFPPTLVGAKVYTFKWTDKVTTTGLVNSVVTDSIVYTLKLVSEKTTKVKVLAGTFNCYTIQTTTKTTENGQTTTGNATQYVAANVGAVKTVSGGTTTVLTKFIKK